MTEETIKITCKNCDSDNVVKNGFYKGNQFYFCKDCNRKFSARKLHPDWTLNNIGDSVGISRERVRQILNGKNKNVCEARKLHPDWTLNNIGDSVGISRERVRQILKRANLDTKSIREVKVRHGDIIVRLYRYCVSYHTQVCKSVVHKDVYTEFNLQEGFSGNLAKRWYFEDGGLFLEKIYKPCKICIR